MFMKKKGSQASKILLEIYRFMEQKTLNWENAKQVLEKLFQMLGKEVDCFIMVLVKKRDKFVFTTLPQDEAQYYINIDAEKQNCRICGKKVCRIRMEAGNIMEGVWIFEMPEDTLEEDISTYKNIASQLKYFLYSCILAQECEKQEKTDCFTGLPANRMFEENLQKRLSNKEAGFLIVVKSPTELPKPYQEDGINFSLMKTVELCTVIHPDGLYRIGPSMLALLCNGEKEIVFSILQELRQKLPESTFFAIPLLELEPDCIYIQIQNGIDARDQKEFIAGESGIFPCLPVF